MLERRSRPCGSQSQSANLFYRDKLQMHAMMLFPTLFPSALDKDVYRGHYDEESTDRITIR
jgi:hypothetical protein